MKNRGIYRTVGSGTVTQANMRLSGVDGGSTASGGAFVDFGAANVLTTKVGHLLKITDSAGKSIMGYIKAAGTGETLGDEKVDTWTNANYETLTLSGSDITQAVNSNADSARAYKQTDLAQYSLAKAVINSYTKTSGIAPIFHFSAVNHQLNTATGSKNTGAFSAGTYYGTISVANSYCGFRNASNDGDWSATGISLKQVLTPSATGVTIVSAQDGTQYNWFNKNSAFNWNDASGYTYQIIQENGKVVSTNNVYTSDFSAGVDGFVGSELTATGNIDSIGGEDNVLRATSNTSNAVHYLVKTTTTAGKYYKVTFKYYIPSGQSNIDGIRLTSSYWGETSDLTTLDSWTTVTKTFVAPSTILRFYALDGTSTTFQDAGGDDVFYIKDVVVTELNAATTVTFGTLHLDASNTAMFFHDSIDFSSYAGTDAGSTPYLLCFYDSSGYMASAYGGAAGGSESLDSEAITGWTTTAPYAFDTLTVNANGHDIDALVDDGGGTVLAYTNTNTISVGKLYKIVIDITLNSGTAPELLTKRGSQYSVNQQILSVVSDQTKYWTGSSALYTDTGLNLRSVSKAVNASLLISQKLLTDVPVTGLHLFTTKNGTTRGMATKASSFNPNTITSVKIYRAY